MLKNIGCSSFSKGKEEKTQKKTKNQHFIRLCTFCSERDQRNETENHESLPGNRNLHSSNHWYTGCRNHLVWGLCLFGFLSVEHHCSLHFGEEKPGCHWKKLLLLHTSPLLLCTISHCEIYPDQFMSLHCLYCSAVEAGVLQTELWLYLLFIISQPSAKRQNKWAHTVHETLSTQVRKIILYKKYLTKINISMSLPDYLCEL